MRLPGSAGKLMVQRDFSASDLRIGGACAGSPASCGVGLSLAMFGSRRPTFRNGSEVGKTSVLLESYNMTRSLCAAVATVAFLVLGSGGTSSSWSDSLYRSCGFQRRRRGYDAPGFRGTEHVSAAPERPRHLRGDLWWPDPVLFRPCGFSGASWPADAECHSVWCGRPDRRHRAAAAGERHGVRPDSFWRGRSRSGRRPDVHARETAILWISVR